MDIIKIVSPVAPTSSYVQYNTQMDPDETLFLAHVSSSLVHWSTRTPNAPAIFGGPSL